MSQAVKPPTARPSARSLEVWLVERLASELSLDPAQVDLDRSAMSYGIDSMIAAQLCAELGDRVQGRELSPDVMWAAPTLRALCRSLGSSESDSAQEPGRADGGDAGVDALGAGLYHHDAGRSLVLLHREARIVAAGERVLLSVLPAQPELVSVSCRHVDETTGEARGSTYYGGRLLAQVRAWVTTTPSEHQLYVLNGAEKPLALTVAAWTCASARTEER
jgi:hypothetical protein